MHCIPVTARRGPHPARGDQTMPMPTRSCESSMPVRLAMRVDDTECVVRATAVWPIADVLDLDSHF